MKIRIILYIFVLLGAIYSYAEEKIEGVLYSEKITLQHEQPLFTDDEALDWAVSRAPLIINLDHDKAEEQFNQNKQYFTKKGWNSFSDAFQNARIIDIIQSNKQTLRSEVNEFPRVLKSGLVEGVYTWEIEFPMTVSYATQDQIKKQELLVWLLLTRTTQVVDQIGIAQWIARPLDVKTKSPL